MALSFSGGCPYSRKDIDTGGKGPMKVQPRCHCAVPALERKFALGAFVHEPEPYVRHLVSRTARK